MNLRPMTILVELPQWVDDRLNNGQGGNNGKKEERTGGQKGNTLNGKPTVESVENGTNLKK
jgi:hypothetical protein